MEEIVIGRMIEKGYLLVKVNPVLQSKRSLLLG